MADQSRRSGRPPRPAIAKDDEVTVFQPSIPPKPQKRSENPPRPDPRPHARPPEPSASPPAPAGPGPNPAAQQLEDEGTMMMAPNTGPPPPMASTMLAGTMMTKTANLSQHVQHAQNLAAAQNARNAAAQQAAQNAPNAHNASGSVPHLRAAQQAAMQAPMQVPQQQQNPNAYRPPMQQQQQQQQQGPMQQMQQQRPQSIQQPIQSMQMPSMQAPNTGPPPQMQQQLQQIQQQQQQNFRAPPPPVGPPGIVLQGTPDSRLVLIAEPESARATSFRMLRDNLLAKTLPRILAVSSALKGDGKTTCALNLGLSLSEGARVLVIDGNLAEPSLHKIFKIDENTPPSPVNGPWASPYRIAEYSPTFHIAALVPMQRVSTPPRFERRWFEQLMAHLRRSHYDFIIVDTASIASAPTVAQMVAICDAAILAVRAGVTTARALRRASEQLTEGKAIGVALIDSKPTS